MSDYKDPDILSFDYHQFDELRDYLKKIGEQRKRAVHEMESASALLQSAVLEAYGVLTVAEIARLTRVSRRAVYDALKSVEPYLD